MYSICIFQTFTFCSIMKLCYIGLDFLLQNVGQQRSPASLTMFSAFILNMIPVLRYSDNAVYWISALREPFTLRHYNNKVHNVMCCTNCNKWICVMWKGSFVVMSPQRIIIQLCNSLQLYGASFSSLFWFSSPQTLVLSTLFSAAAARCFQWKALINPL